MSLKKKIFGETLIYGISKYASLIAAIFLTPIYTRLLTKEDYGVMDVFNKWNAFALTIVPLGLFGALVRFYPEIKNEVEKRKEYLGSIFLSLIGLCLIYSLFMLSIKPLFIHIFLDQGFKNIDFIFYLSLALIIFQVLFGFSQEILRVNHQSVIYAFLSLSNFGILTGLGFYYIYFQHENIAGFFKASVMASFFAVILSFVFNRKNIYFTFSSKTLRKLLNYSIHLLSATILFQVSDLFDRYLIKDFFSLKEVGIFSIATRISGILSILISSMAVAWMPYVFEIKGESYANRVYDKMFRIYTIGGFTLVCYILIFREELIRFFAPDYMAASGIIVLLSIFNFIMGLAYTLSIGIHISTRTRAVSIGALWAFVIKIISSIVLINSFGVIGIAWASLIESMVWIGTQHYFSQKYHKIDFKYTPLISLLFFIPVVFIADSIHSDSLIMQFTYKALFAVTLSMVSYSIVRKHIRPWS